MSKQLQATAIEEQKMIGKAVLLLIKQNTELKDFIGKDYASFNYLDKDCDVGLFPTKGAAYLSKNIMGGYKAQYPFSIFVRKSAPTDKDRMALADFADNLCTYIMENKDAIILDSDRKVDSIEQTSLTTLVERVGSIDTYRVDMRLIYKKE